ncbi:MAG TPA: hypothetical protein PKL92_02455 [Aquaticitalea sp.]|nr:hypothetical protein [Aquaticitalea sp.]HNU59492.1 hypothetical protein [Aquaticitalea sp.]
MPYVLDQQSNGKPAEFCFDISATLYNKGIPFVRLIKEESMNGTFERMYKKKKSTQQIKYQKKLQKACKQF